MRAAVTLVTEAQHLKPIRVTGDPHQFSAEVVHIDPRPPVYVRGGYSLDSSKILIGVLDLKNYAGYLSLLRLFREFVNPLIEES